jgi:hypothetical protein
MVVAIIPPQFFFFRIIPLDGTYRYFNLLLLRVLIASSNVSTNGSPAKLKLVLNKIGTPVNFLNASIKL